MYNKPPATPAPPPAPPDAQAFAEAHRQLLANPDIQFQLTPVPAPEPQPIPDISGALPFAQVIFWAAVAAIVLFILYLIGRRLTEADWSRRKGGGDEAPEAWRPDAAQARELLGDADALAAQGRYSEAARLLLFRSIEDIDRRKPDLVRPAFTSRDIGALDALPSRPRSAFQRIAMLVERSLFAARPLAADDWSQCRVAYEEFAFAEGWRG